MRLNKQFYLPILITLLTVTGPIQTVTAAEVMTADDVKTDKKLRLPNDGRSDLQELIQRVATDDTGDGQPTEPEPDEPETPEVAQVEQPKVEADPQVEEPLAKTDSKPASSGKAPRAITTNTNGTSTWTFDSDTGLLVFGAGQLAQPIYSNIEAADLYRGDVKKIQFESNVIAPVSVTYLFANLGQLSDFIDLQNFDTSNVTSMVYWFYNSKGLTNPDLSALNTSNVMNMSYMFYGSGVTSLDLSGWSVDKVASFSYMFYDDTALSTLNLSNWGSNRTATAVNMSYMFAVSIGAISELDTLNLTNFKTNNVTDMSYMFQCTRLNKLDLHTWNVAKVLTFANMFYQAKLTALNLSNWRNNDASTSTSMASMFSQTRALTELNLSDFSTANVTDMSSMFSATQLEFLDLHMWNVTKVTSFSFMFNNAKNLKELNLTDWGSSRTATTVNMRYMFYGTETLTTLNLTNFKTTNVNDMQYMFYGTGLESLNLSSWDVTKVANFNYMFCVTSSLKTLDLSNWGVDRTASAVTMLYMFSNSTALTNLILTNFKTTNVKNLSGMFRLTALTDLDLSNWDVTKVTDFSSMFNNSKIRTLNLSGWNTLSDVRNFDVTFTGTADLWKITLSENIKFTKISTFVTAPSIGTTITDNGQNYKTTSASWQIVGNGTDHHPTGDMVTTTEMYADRLEPVTYVWAQAPTFDGVANLTFGPLGAGDFRNGNKPLATNMATGTVNLINLESGIPYKVSVVQTSDWTTSGQSATISKNDLSIQYGDNSLTDSVDFWLGNSTTSQKSILFNHNTTNAFSIWLNPNAVIDTILLGKQLQSELTWTLSETP